MVDKHRNMAEHSDIFWRPSLSILSERCCDSPLYFERDIEAVQAVHLNDCIFVGGASCSRWNPDECRLLVYSLSADNWNALDAGVFRFALTSYKSRLTLIGGKQYYIKDDGIGSIVTATNHVLVLDFTSLELQDQIIPSMQTKRASACAVSSGDHLIVAGGDEGNTVEVYNSESNEWSYVSPLRIPQVSDPFKVKSGTLHSDGNLYLHLQNYDKNYVFFAPIAVLVSSGGEGNNSNTWQNLKSQSLPHVCSNLTTHLGHLVLIGSDSEHSSNYAFFVYSPDAKRWMAVADLPIEECLVKQRVPPHDQAPLKNCLVSLSSKELLLLGELVNSYYRHIILRVSFRTAAIDLKSSFTYRDLEKLKFPVLKVFEDQYDLDEKLELDESAVPTYGVLNEKDPAGIQSIKKWINLKHPEGKAVSWKNLLWLLDECKADTDDPKAVGEMINNLKAYITAAPRGDSEPEEMDTNHKTLQMIASITSDVKELCTSAALKDAVSDSDRNKLITTAKVAEKKLVEEFNAIEKETEAIKAEIKEVLAKNNIIE